MHVRIFLAVSVTAALTAVACDKSPSAPTQQTTPAAVSQPASPGDGGEIKPEARTGVTMAAPQPVTPADGAQIKNSAQPVALVISNGLSAASSTAVSYTFEVATDAAFGSKVYTKESLPEGSGGRTSLTIDKIGPDKSYYWRARTNTGDVAGPNSRIRSFTIGPEVILQTPALLSPGQGATATVPILLTVRNVQKTGPAGSIRYQFELSESDAFNNLVFSTTADEQSAGQTSVTVNTTLTANAIYFWRVRASDAENDVTTPFSPTFSFKAQTFDATQAVFHDNPPDVGFWPVGAAITSIDFTPDAILVEFNRRVGSNRWPDVAFGTGDIQYTLGMCVNVNGQWHCSAVVQFWFGRDLGASGRPSDVGFEWFYNPFRWGAMTGHQPAEGETVGIFVAAGNLRNNSYTIASCPRVCERSNVVLVPYTSRGGASYVFSQGSRVRR